MAWQVLAIWLIVIVTITWFIRDERRLRAEAELERAARYYAHAPKYRHVNRDELEPLPVRRTGGLSQEQRNFLQEMAKQKRVAEG